MSILALRSNVCQSQTHAYFTKVPKFPIVYNTRAYPSVALLYGHPEMLVPKYKRLLLGYQSFQLFIIPELIQVLPYSMGILTLTSNACPKHKRLLLGYQSFQLFIMPEPIQVLPYSMSILAFCSNGFQS
jgi:hypothetical protein